MSRSVLRVLQCFHNLLLGCFAKAGQFSDAPGFACLLQLLDGTDLKLVVESLDLFGAKPGQ